MAYDPERITFFAKTDARGQNIPFGIKAKDRTRHVYVIGKTGMGKSTLLENMAVQDIKHGEGMAFIDPHGATAETLLDYIPEERKDDVLYFAPFDMEHPVSFNVMEDVGADKRHLVVSGLMSVFEKIWVDAWSARMAYILQNTLMALLEYPDATLLGVNRVLSDKNYRKKVVDNISDPSVKAFWVDEFAKYNERYMQEAGDAIKNKIGQFTANPLIRNIIGQPKSSFDIRKIMDEQKILIMNLSKGLVGESNANLLGSMLTTRIYLAAMSRADLPQAQMREMPNFYFYVDEFQSFANATFADILSEARKYKLNLTIAHQYIEQMEEEVKNAVFGNVGTIVSFRVGPFDAEVLETIFAPEFYAVDICNLGFAQIYLTLMIDGIGSKPFSAVTLPPIEHQGVSCKEIILHASRSHYAKPRAEVEEAILGWHEQQHASESGGSGAKPLSVRRSDNRKSGQQNDRRPDSRNGNDRKPANDYRKDRPKRDNGDKSSGGKPSGNQQNSKNLEELRAVLAGLSNKESEKSVKKEDNKSEPAEKLTNRDSKTNAGAKKSYRKDESSQSSAPKQTAEKSTSKSDDSTEALKAALAGVLGGDKPKKDNSSEQPTSSHNQSNYQQPSSAKLETDKGKKGIGESQKGFVSTPVEAKSAELNVPIKAEPKQEAVMSKVVTEGPIDPKVIERMMRVKSDDRTPLK